MCVRGSPLVAVSLHWQLVAKHSIARIKPQVCSLRHASLSNKVRPHAPNFPRRFLQGDNVQAADKRESQSSVLRVDNRIVCDRCSSLVGRLHCRATLST
jgi:hypothetical protein